MNTARGLSTQPNESTRTLTAASKLLAKSLAAIGTAVLVVGLVTVPGWVPPAAGVPVSVAAVEAPGRPGAALELGSGASQRLSAASAPRSEAATPPLITSDLADAAIGRFGTRTSKTFVVVVDGSKLRYLWQHRSASGSWKTISGARSARYTARASKWANGTRFRVIVTGEGGKVVSATAKLTVLSPTRTPARDAEAAFALAGLSQGVDLSAYQHTPSQKVRLKAIAAWAGGDGFALLRNGSGARPIKQLYTSACTNRSGKTGGEPVTMDCAYRGFADAAQGAGLSLGHYWFNGWVTSIDTTPKNLFSGDYTPADSARQFVKWLKRYGNYTRASTDPLVLDIEAGHAWTKTYKGKTYKRTLRAWNPTEATEFLTTVKDLLTSDGYQPNLYVYMSANAAARESAGRFVWTDVAGIARLWVASWGTNNGRIPDSLPKVGPWVDHGGWSIWQYTSNAGIPGDGVGALDADIAKADAWTPPAPVEFATDVP